MKLLALKSLLIAAALPLAACSSAAAPTPAELTLDRDPILVSEYVGTVSPISVQMLNGGRGTLTVTSVKLTLADGGALAQIDAGGIFDQPLVVVDAGAISDPLPVEIGGMQTGFLQFNYGPRHAGLSDVVLVIESDAADASVLTVPVNACAVAVDGGPDAGC